MPVNFDYYKIFYYVAEYGSMGKAAEELCLTPPSITKTIHALEMQLNCRLFTRTAKGAQLTATGEALYKHIKPGVRLIMSGEREVNMLNSLEGGTVKIAMGEATSRYYTLPETFKEFCSRYPKVKLVILHIPSQEAKNAILSGDIDFAILTSPADGSELNVKYLFASNNVPIVGRDFNELAQRRISIKELSKYPLVFASGALSIRAYYTQFYKNCGLEFNPNIELATMESQLDAVRHGMGYSFAPYQYIKRDIEAGTLFKLDIEEDIVLRRDICMLTAKNLPLSRAAQALADLLLEKLDNNLAEI